MQIKGKDRTINKLIDIIAMSMERDRLIDKLSDNRALQFAHHCGYILLFGKTQEISHWTDEMFSFCSWIQDTTLKPNNKPISYELIMEYFFGYDDSIETFNSMLDRSYLEETNKNRKDKKKDSEKFRKYRDFCNQVAQLLAQRTLNKNKLSNLVQQYLL